MRRAAKRDAGEAQIVEALRAVGALVVQLDAKDVPDLLCGFGGAWLLMEVKQPKGKKGGTHEDGQHLSLGQEAFFAKARARALPVVVVRTPGEALSAIGLTTRGAA